MKYRMQLLSTRYIVGQKKSNSMRDAERKPHYIDMMNKFESRWGGHLEK